MGSTCMTGRSQKCPRDWMREMPSAGCLWQTDRQEWGPWWEGNLTNPETWKKYWLHHNYVQDKMENTTDSFFTSVVTATSSCMWHFGGFQRSRKCSNTRELYPHVNARRWKVHYCTVGCRDVMGKCPQLYVVVVGNTEATYIPSTAAGRRVGTCCSGSDQPVGVAHFFFKRMHFLGIGLFMKHVSFLITRCCVVVGMSPLMLALPLMSAIVVAGNQWRTDSRKGSTQLVH